MVLVDTSVWVRFLANKSPYAAELDRLLDQQETVGHNLIYGELLIGDPSGRGELLKSYRLMYRISDVCHDEVVEFVRRNKLYRSGIGWIDAHLLASCLVAAVPLWTADRRLFAAAGQMGVSYTPSLQ
jgi:predicted nucleic acid-binding protein